MFICILAAVLVLVFAWILVQEVRRYRKYGIGAVVESLGFWLWPF